MGRETACRLDREHTPIADESLQQHFHISPGTRTAAIDYPIDNDHHGGGGTARTSVACRDPRFGL
jgi:hypothetical protein